MMKPPECFVERIINLSYPELIRERDRLIRFLQDFEKKEMAGDRTDLEWGISPSPAVRYQMYFMYLAEICGIMHEKYNKEYACEDRTLKDDCKEK